MLQPCQWTKQIWAHVSKKRNTTANSHCLSYVPLFVRVLLYVIPAGKFCSETAESFHHPLVSRTHGLVPECVQVHMVFNKAGEGIQSKRCKKVLKSKMNWLNVIFKFKITFKSHNAKCNLVWGSMNTWTAEGNKFQNNWDIYPA